MTTKKEIAAGISLVWEGSAFTYLGKKTRKTSACDGCGISGSLVGMNVLEGTKEDGLTFWCDCCLEDVRAKQPTAQELSKEEKAMRDALLSFDGLRLQQELDLEKQTEAIERAVTRGVLCGIKACETLLLQFVRDIQSP